MDTQTGLIERGATFYRPEDTIDTTTPNYGTSVDLEGMITKFPATNPTSSGKVSRFAAGSREVECILVRNVSGIHLMPGLAVVWKTGKEGRRVDGYTSLTSQPVAGFVDDHLPISGVRNGDLFWLIVKGPVLTRMAVTPATAGTIWLAGSTGDVLAALTANAASTAKTTGGTTADDTGCLYPFTFAVLASTDVVAYSVANICAKALSAVAASTTSTNGLVLIESFCHI